MLVLLRTRTGRDPAARSEIEVGEAKNYPEQSVQRQSMLIQSTLSAILSRKHCLFPNPSADRQTLSPVPVQDRHTMSSWQNIFTVISLNLNIFTDLYL